MGVTLQAARVTLRARVTSRYNGHMAIGVMALTYGQAPLLAVWECPVDVRAGGARRREAAQAYIERSVPA